MKKILFSLITLFLTGLTLAQAPDIDGEIYGKVIDAGSDEAIEFATISIVSTTDSSVVTGNISGDEGVFIIDDVPVGEYYVIVSYIGYEEITVGPVTISGSNKKEDLGTIKINSQSENIQEVVVRQRRDAIETRLDKRVFNAGQDVASQSGDALEMMRNVPSIEVDIDGNISLRGNENVKILIDGRPPSFSASDILRQTPASSIERVEIITNPGAKYDPEGTAGIINIVMKRNDDAGFNGNVNLGMTQATYMSYNGSVGLNWRNKNFNSFINYGYTGSKRNSEGRQDRFIEGDDELASISQESGGYRTRGGHNIDGGMDFYLNDQNTVYWSGTYRLQNNPGERFVDYRYFNPAGDQTFSEQRFSDQMNKGDNYRLNVGWVKLFDNPEHKLELDAVYDVGERLQDQEYFNREYDDNGELLPVYDQEKQGERRLDSKLITQLDYTQPFGDNMSMEAGLRHDMTLKNTDTRFSTFNQDGEYERDPTRSNIFNYNENIFAAYASWGHEMGAFGYKIGLRHETTLLNSELKNESDVFDQTYSRLYPSVHLMYDLNPTNTFLLSYSRRVERPNSWQLNPFTNYSDPLNLRSGNPFLEPEDIHSIEGGYKKIWEVLTLNMTGYYKVITNQIRRYIESSGEITKSTFQNFGTTEEIGLETILSIRPAKWWNISSTINTYQSTLSNYGGFDVANERTVRFRTQFNSQMTLPQDINFQISGYYSAPFKSAQADISAFRSINLALSKSFLDDKLRVSVNTRDIFGWMRFEADITINDFITEYTMHKWDSRSVGVSVAYNFGKGTMKKEKGNMQRQQMGEGMETDGFK